MRSDTPVSRLFVVIVITSVTVLALACGGCKKKRPTTAQGKEGSASSTLSLPTSVSNTALTPAPLVQVRRDAITVAGKTVVPVRHSKVPGRAKRDGPDGYFIDPLFKALQGEVRVAKTAAKRHGLPFRGRMQLAVDGSTVYRLLAEVLYTAAQAELEEFLLEVKGPSGKPTAVLVKTPKVSKATRLGGPQTKPPLHLKVVMTKRGFYVKTTHGSECPPDEPKEGQLCVAAKGGRFTPAVLRKLQHLMWHLFAQKYRYDAFYATPEEHFAVMLLVEPTLRFRDVVHTLDALREIPRDATQPKPPSPIPHGGCSPKLDPKTGKWGFAESGRGSVRDLACMYYRVTLALGSR